MTVLEQRRNDYQDKILHETREDPETGALLWEASGNPVPLDIFKTALIEAPEGQAAAIAANTAAFLAEYRANPPKIDDEQMYEMRAAFGPGETVVNVITGEKTFL